MHFDGRVVTERLKVTEPRGFLVGGLCEGEVLALRSHRIDQRCHLEDHLGAVLACGLHGNPSENFRNIAALDRRIHPGVGARCVCARDSQNHKAVLQVDLEICRFHILVANVQEGRVAGGRDGASDKHPASHHVLREAHVDLVLGGAVETECPAACRVGNLLHKLLVRGLLLLWGGFLLGHSLGLLLFLLLFLKHGRSRVCGRNQQRGGDQSEDNTPFCHDSISV